MQTIEEQKAYTKQLEGEVGKWHSAYDALVIERNQLVSRIKELEERKTKSEKNTADLVKAYEEKLADNRQQLSNAKEIIETCSSELEELRKHELQWDLDKARIKELESQCNRHDSAKTGK